MVSYIDTHIARWLMDGDVGKLTMAAKEYIEKTDLLISPIVFLELQYLYEIKRVSSPAQDVYNYLHGAIGLCMCHYPFPNIVLTAANENWTRDVFDRLIVSQAKANGESPLITADRNMRDNYAKAIW